MSRCSIEQNIRLCRTYRPIDAVQTFCEVNQLLICVPDFVQRPDIAVDNLIVLGTQITTKYLNHQQQVILSRFEGDHYRPGQLNLLQLSNCSLVPQAAGYFGLDLHPIHCCGAPSHTV